MGSRSYCFTLNNPKDVIPSFQHARYLIWQLEKGENGTEHIQGYVELSKPQRVAALVKELPRTHFEARRGTREQARDYCRKEDTRIAGPFESGEWRAGGAGRRTDLSELKTSMDAGASEFKLSQDHYEEYMRYARTIRDYRAVTAPKRSWKTEVRVYWGESGTGKSTRAFEEAGEDAYVKGVGDWWCGYDGHEHVIIDDFYGGIQYTMFLHILDRYRMQVPIKGGQRPFLAKVVWITSNRPPTEWYPNVPDKTPILRRITTTVHYNKPFGSASLPARLLAAPQPNPLSTPSQ